MPAFNSVQMTAPLAPISGPGIGGRTIHTVRGFVDFSTTGTMAIADTINFMQLPPRFRATGGYLKFTGAAVSCTLAIGDSGAAARYFAATAITTAGTTLAMAEAGRDFITTGKTTIVGVIAGAATGTSGTVTVVLTGYIEGPQ